jgi:hypothetical protein
MRSRRLAVLAAATITVSVGLLAQPAAAMTFGIETGNGFISRGDVISHPMLGKAALSYTPNITFSKDGAHYEQDCYKTNGAYQMKTFQQGLSNVNFAVTTRVASGNDNITGYLLNSLGGGVTKPTTLCPSNWLPYNGDTVTLVSGRNLPPLMVYRNGVYNGAWYYDFTTLTWIIQP